MRLSRILRTPDTPAGADSVPLRRVLLWAIVGLAIIVGIVLYFRFERQITPLVG